MPKSFYKLIVPFVVFMLFSSTNLSPTYF